MSSSTSGTSISVTSASSTSVASSSFSSSPSTSSSSSGYLAELSVTTAGLDDPVPAFLFSLRRDSDDETGELKLRLHVGAEVFEGKYGVDEASLRGLADKLDLEPNLIDEMSRTALTTNLNEEFSYELKRGEGMMIQGAAAAAAANNSSAATLIWKQEVEGTGLMQKIGEARFERVVDAEEAARALESTFSFSARTIAEANGRKRKAEAESERSTADRRRAVKRYEECVAESKTREEELFQKFVVILNEKKEKIRKLTRSIDEKEETAGENDHRNVKKEDSNPDEMSQMIYGEDTDVDSDTEDREVPSDEGEDKDRAGPSNNAKEDAKPNPPPRSFGVGKLLDVSSDDDDLF